MTVQLVFRRGFQGFAFGLCFFGLKWIFNLLWPMSKRKTAKKPPSNCRSKTEEKMTPMLKYILMFELLQCLHCHLYFCTVFSYLSLISVICSITLTWSFSQISMLHSFRLAYLSFTCHLSLFHSSLLTYDKSVFL